MDAELITALERVWHLALSRVEDLDEQLTEDWDDLDDHMRDEMTEVSDFNDESMDKVRRFIESNGGSV